ncbi:MAG: hypothetical protein QXJ68_07360 [Methanocellales archaeon]
MNGTLEETFVNIVKEAGKYRMLYRSWESPLSSDEKLSFAYIELLNISPPLGAVPYVKDYKGVIRALSLYEEPLYL